MKRFIEKIVDHSNISEPLVDSLSDLLTQDFVLEPVLLGVHLVRVVIGAEDVVSFLLLTSVTGLLQLGLLGVLFVFGGKVLEQELDQISQ